MRKWVEAKARAKSDISRIAADASKRPRQEQRRRLPVFPPRRARETRSRPK